MNKIMTLKRIFALLIACSAAAGAFSSEWAFADSADSSFAEAVTELGDSSSSKSTDGADYENSDTGEATSDDQQSQTGIDVSEYTNRLNDIAEKRAELDRQLSETDDEMADESERQRLILEKINVINEKSEVINSYMTQLEIQISAEQRSLEELRNEIDRGIEDYKKRLRAMYIAGDLSYTDVLLSSGDFFDVLMRSELVRRVADHDARALDELVEKKASYDQRMKDLEAERLIYDDQARQLDNERAELAEIYNSSSAMKKLLKEEKKKMQEDQRTYENEIYSYEGILDDLLKGNYGSSDDETFRLQTELEAAAAIQDLHASQKARTDAGEVISEYESRYTFKWPVAGHYYVSSGVGARWGAYHKGLDIPGESGTPIAAAEAGEVVRINNTCTHNYGKDGSCGCGGGYGNFVVIDHGNGFLTLYGHMSSASVEIGDKVKEGQTIGLMGSTGYSTGTHLHFELRFGGYVTNPAAFVSF